MLIKPSGSRCSSVGHLSTGSQDTTAMPIGHRAWGQTERRGPAAPAVPAVPAAVRGHGPRCRSGRDRPGRLRLHASHIISEVSSLPLLPIIASALVWATSAHAHAYNCCRWNGTATPHVLCKCAKRGRVWGMGGATEMHRARGIRRRGRRLRPGSRARRGRGRHRARRAPAPRRRRQSLRKARGHHRGHARCRHCGAGPDPCREMPRRA